MTKPKKRKPSEHSEGNSRSKTQKLNRVKEGTICSVCTKQIIERSENHDGDEAIFCDGGCGWLHRQCAGLSDPFFKAFTFNDTPFLCVFCMLKSQSDEISSLRSTIEQLKITLEGLSKHNSPQAVISSDDNDPPAVNSTPTLINQVPIPKPAEKSSSQVKHRFNVVLYGISESPSNASRPERMKHDLDTAVVTLNKLNKEINHLSIRDSFRLGKFKQNQARPWPLLIKLNRAIDVITILANRGSLEIRVS